jgi:hypothetical protein
MTLSTEWIVLFISELIILETTTVQNYFTCVVWPWNFVFSSEDGADIEAAREQSCLENMWT